MSNASYPGSSRNSRGQPQNRNGSFHQADTSNWGGNHPHPLHQARPGQYPPSSYTGNRAAYQNRGSLPTPIRGMGEVFPSPHQRYRSNGGYVLDRSQYQSRGAPPVQTRNRDEWFNLDTHQAYDGYRSGHRQPVQPQSASTASSNSRDRFHSPKFAGPPDRWQANTHTQTIARANPHVRRDSGSESIALRSSSPSNHLSSEERKMKDLIRVLETQAALTRRDSEGEFSSSIFWTEDHSQSFSRVLEQMDRVDNPESRQMAIKTLILAFHRMMACKSASRFEANERARIGDLKEGLVNRVYDMCEDGDEQVRKAGYLAMKDLSECDRTLLKRNADILVQLLQHEDPTEHELIATALLEHVRQSPLDSFDVIVQDHCREELRPLALSFLASPQSEVVLQDVVVGITANEAGLAERLSEVIPLADQEELELLAILLRPLETLWLPPFDFATTEEWETTARAARKVITALLEVTLKQLGGDSESRGDILDPEKMPDMQPVLPFFQALLNHLCSKSTSASITDQQGVKLVNFVAEQEGALKLAEILLGSYSHPGDANRPLSWMKPKPSAWVGQILANSMARLSVILDDPTVRTSLTNEQLNAFDQTSKRLAEGTIQSLIDLVPAIAPGDMQPEADRQLIFVAEALLCGLLQTVPPLQTKVGISNASDPIIENPTLHSHLRFLYGFSQEMKSADDSTEDYVGGAEMRESARNVFDIVKEYLKPRHLRGTVSVNPAWARAPQAFIPQETLQAAKRNHSTDDEAGEREESERKRSKNDSESVPNPSSSRAIGAPRGRGQTQAPTYSDDEDLYWDKDGTSEYGIVDREDKPQPTVSLSIRGAAASSSRERERSGKLKDEGQSEGRGAQSVLSIQGSSARKGWEENGSTSSGSAVVPPKGPKSTGPASDGHQRRERVQGAPSRGSQQIVGSAARGRWRAQTGSNRGGGGMSASSFSLGSRLAPLPSNSARPRAKESGTPTGPRGKRW